MSKYLIFFKFFYSKYSKCLSSCPVCNLYVQMSVGISRCPNKSMTLFEQPLLWIFSEKRIFVIFFSKRYCAEAGLCVPMSTCLYVCVSVKQDVHFMGIFGNPRLYSSLCLSVSLYAQNFKNRIASEFNWRTSDALFSLSVCRDVFRLFPYFSVCLSSSLVVRI